MPLVLALAPAILQAIMMILSWFAKKSLTEQQQAEFFIHWKSLCRILNLKDLVEKHEQVNNQLKENSDAWDKIEAEEKKKTTSPKLKEK